MRSLVYGLLSTDDDLAVAGEFSDAEALAAATYGSNSVDTPQSRPFIILSWGVTTDKVGTMCRRDLVVWVHDEPGDYTRIDNMLKRVRVVLENIFGAKGVEEDWVAVADWQGESADLADDNYQTITRNATYRVVGSLD